MLIANRSRDRADALAAALAAQYGSAAAAAVSYEDLAGGRVVGDVLANSTSVGMAPNTEESPVPAAVAGQVRERA